MQQKWACYFRHDSSWARDWIMVDKSRRRQSRHVKLREPSHQTSWKGGLLSIIVSKNRLRVIGHKTKLKPIQKKSYRTRRKANIRSKQPEPNNTMAAQPTNTPNNHSVRHFFADLGKAYIHRAETRGVDSAKRLAGLTGVSYRPNYRRYKAAVWWMMTEMMGSIETEMRWNDEPDEQRATVRHSLLA